MDLETRGRRPRVVNPLVSHWHVFSQTRIFSLLSSLGSHFLFDELLQQCIKVLHENTISVRMNKNRQGLKGNLGVLLHIIQVMDFTDGCWTKLCLSEVLIIPQVGLSYIEQQADKYTVNTGGPPSVLHKCLHRLTSRPSRLFYFYRKEWTNVRLCMVGMFL